MANCIYIYKGHKFNSELELDDFLLINGDDLYTKYGDLVFQSELAALTCDQLHNIQADSELLQRLYNDAKLNADYHLGETNLKFKKPYIGVTSFLRGLKDSSGHVLFPEFREFEYWRRRVKDWKNENIGFNSDEEELFGNSVVLTDELNEQELSKWLEEYSQLKKQGKAIKRPENQILQLIYDMKLKWEFLGKAGTSIHDVLKRLFTAIDSKGPNNGKLILELDDDFLINKYFGGDHPNFNQEYLNINHVKDIIQYARQLKLELNLKFGKDLSFFPEFLISSLLNQPIDDTGCHTVLGIIDLLIVDSDGNTHIVDYKASPKNSFDTAKERTFWYLLGMYTRLLQNNNIKVESKTPKVMVAPIKMDKFKKENNKFTFSGIFARDAECLLDITSNATLGTVSEKLDEFIPIKHLIDMTPDKIIQNVNKFNSSSFQEINTSKTWEDEDIKKVINNSGGIQKDEETKKYFIKLNNYNKPFTGESEVDVFNKVKEYFLVKLPKSRKEMVLSVLISLRLGIKQNTSDIELPNVGYINSQEGASLLWFKNLLGKYCNSKYKILENPAFIHYGMVALLDMSTGLIDIIKVTSDDLDFSHKFNDQATRQLITGCHVKDSVQAKKPGNLALKAVNGNIHLMETMAILNCMPEITNQPNAIIGQIIVANPHSLLGMSASNEELVYNFNELTSYIKDFSNNIKNIRFANYIQLARNRLKHIMSAGEEKNWSDQYNKNFKNYQSILTELDGAISESDKRCILRKLEELRIDLEKHYKLDIETTTELYDEDVNIARSLYDKIILAIAEVKGVTFRLLIRDNNKHIENTNIPTNGIQSIMLDNPGNLNNDTLNLLTKLVTEAYQNVREDIQREMKTVRKMVDKLKTDMNFGKFKEMTGGNNANLFINMIRSEADSDGDILFKNPWDPNTPMISETQRDFLKYTITKINEGRYPDIPILEYSTSNDLKYFRVPLAEGDLSSRSAILGGLSAGLKSKLNRINPTAWWEDAQRRLTGVYEDSDFSKKDKGDLFEMSNMFERGEKNLEERLHTILENGREYFEYNLETLLIKHMFAYSVQTHINTVMPMAKAAMIHLITLGHLTNKKYVNATNYVSDYIKNKIKGESLITNKDARKFNAILGKIKLAASFMILGFAPVLYGGLMLLSLWMDIRLMYQNKGEDTPFTFENFRFACKEVYKDFFKLGGKPTICSLINEFYAINDMDMNVYADKIKSDRYGLFNLSNIAFHCASRPDFFSRMSLLLTQMKKDGTWEAHSIVDGALYYDWTKDKRFDIYAKSKSDPSLKKDPKYAEQRGLYYAMAELLEKEHALNSDGTYFKIGLDLPKAYTNLLMESYKSIADNIYGYYAHEKKAMIHSMTLGSLWMLMRTFWSGKKNQYLGGPGVKLQGKFVLQQTEVDGKIVPMFLKEEDGKMVPTPENTGIPLYKWEGQWLEGILITMCKIINDSMENGFKTTFDDLWSRPENSLERQNIKQLIYDLTMFTIVGPIMAGILQGWDDDLEKEAKDTKQVSEGAISSAAHMAMKMVSYSFGDFNFISSIGSPLVNWLPFSFAYWLRLYSNLIKVCMGEKDFYDAVLQMSGATANSKTFFETLAA